MRTLVTALAALTFATRAGAQTRQLEAVLPLPKPAALARVQAVFADDGLPIASATGDVVEGRATDKLLKLRFLASLIPVDSTHTRVVLTAFGTRPAAFGLPEAEAQVHERTGGLGRKVWARLERLHAALAPADSSARS